MAKLFNTARIFALIEGCAVALVIAILLAVCPPSTANAQDAPAAMMVGVDSVRDEPLSQTMPVVGRLVATQSGVVSARTTGPLGEFRVQIGDRVEKDAIIATLVNDALRARRELWLAEVAQAKAVIETSRTQLKLHQQELTRLEDLKTSAAFSQARLDDKRQDVAKSTSEIAEDKAALSVARANLMLAEIDLYNADIRAPYDGVVSQRHTDVGAFVRAGDALITLIDDSTLEIDADIPTGRVTGLSLGTSVTYRIGDAMNGTAFVRAVVPDENPLTRTRSVRFSARLDTSNPLAANQSVTLHIPLGAMRTVITVHKDAILNRGGKSLVFMAIDGIATARPVRLGEAVGERFVVLDGLVPGDLVVVRGNERVRPDQAITFATPDSASQG